MIKNDAGVEKYKLKYMNIKLLSVILMYSICVSLNCYTIKQKLIA